MLDNEMSPLEAVHVAATMLHQKLTNPIYQMTNDERRAKQIANRTHAPALTKQEADMRREEMQQLLFTAPRFAFDPDMFLLTTNSLALLGVGQTGGNQ